MKFRKIVKEDAREEWEDLKAHWTASSKSKMHDQFRDVGAWNKAHPVITCDRCGFTSRHEDFFGIVGDEILCDKCRRGMNESSDLDDYEIGQKMQDFADKNIPEVRSVVTGGSPGMIYVVLNPDVYIMADEAKEIARELISASGARGYRYAGVNKADPYIIIARRRVNESIKSAKKMKNNWWHDVPGAKYIYHGDWSDPEVQYMGFSFSYWDVEEGLLNEYREEHPEDKNDKGFDDWFDTLGGPNGRIQGELENMCYAALGDNGVDDKEWLGIPDAFKVNEIYG